VQTLRYRFSPLAEADIRTILEESFRLFGPHQQERYFNLLMTAVERVAADPLGLGSKACDELGRGWRSFHIENAARRRGAAAHVLFYRPVVDADGEAEILIARVLHDRMDPERHIAD
jgi:toxin ParE1/3/4